MTALQMNVTIDSRQIENKLIKQKIMTKQPPMCNWTEQPQYLF